MSVDAAVEEREDRRALSGGAVDVLRRGWRLLPEVRRGLVVTLLLALLATAGRVVVPLAVQQVVDRGVLRDGGPEPGVVGLLVGLAAVAVLITAVTSAVVTRRLVTTTETALASLRTRAFAHVHALSPVARATGERRGALVSRVTSDVDQLSVFMQWGGVLLVVTSAQVLLATLLMLVWSPPLALVVLGVLVPVALLVPRVTRRLAAAHGRVRRRVADLLTAVGEAVVGAPVLRAYGVSERTGRRVADAVEAHRKAQTRAIVLAAGTFSAGEVVTGVVLASVVGVGAVLAGAGSLTAGQVVGFAFLVTLLVGPLQIGVEVLNEAQNAVAGLRRVLDLLDEPVEVADPDVDDAVTLPDGPLDLRVAGVGYRYPSGTAALHDVDLAVAAGEHLAVVGETGSGKTTLLALLARLVDPSSGRVLAGGVDLRRVADADLRRRVLLVPQEGFLVDGTVAENVRWGDDDLDDAGVADVLDGLGLRAWREGLPDGVATRVGQRGGSLSAGERQLVALARAAAADPDVLLLDEATSAVDPATEVRLSAALGALTRGRTTVTVAHRLSTAEAADRVAVVAAGRVVEQGVAADLAAAGGEYARLDRAWRSGLSA